MPSFCDTNKTCPVCGEKIFNRKPGQGNRIYHEKCYDIYMNFYILEQKRLSGRARQIAIIKASREFKKERGLSEDQNGS